MENQIKLTRQDKSYLKFMSEMLFNLKFHERILRRNWGNSAFDGVYYDLQHELSALLEHIDIQHEKSLDAEYLSDS